MPLRMVLAITLGVATYGAAQAPVSDRLHLVAQRVQRDGAMTRLRGSVSVHIPGAVVTADEALYDESTGEFQLRGNVRLKLDRSVQR